MVKNAVVIGATGDVGRGVVKALLLDGYQVIAVGRMRDKLDAFRSEFPSDAALHMVVGSVADEAAAKAAADDVLAIGVPDVVVTSVNGLSRFQPLFDFKTTEIATTFQDNVLTHYAAAKSFVPIIRSGGTYIGIGGGMVDIMFPGTVAASMSQAALRNFYRFLAVESAREDINIRELILYSMIAGKSNAGATESSWITDDECGRHVSAVLKDLTTFDGPILTLKSRKQVGLPARKPV